MKWTGSDRMPANATGARQPPARRQASQLLNTAGEAEPETRSRRANLLEALLLLLALLATLWWLAYPLGVLLQWHAANVASSILTALLVVFALFFSPWWHGDTPQSRGLGSPAALVRWLGQGSWARRLGLGALLGAVVLALTAELYRNFSGATRLVVGVEPVLTLDLRQSLGGSLPVLGLCLGLALVWVTCFVRYDNLRSALKAALAIVGVLLPLILLVGWALNGPEVFRSASLRQLVPNALGYSFWGALQQLLFCSYFGTRLRKGLAPAQPDPAWRWKRLGAAMLTGLFFGLVHMNSWLLVGFTWVLGTVLAWFFMEERYRNLQAMGLVHGLLGACAVWLFSGQHDALQIRFRVGPWAMPHHLDLPTVVVSGTFLLSVGVALLLLLRFRPQAQRA